MNDYYNKTVKDAYGDSADVQALRFIRKVTLTAFENEGQGDERSAYLSFTPKQARRLAKALRKAAKLAEENA